MREFAENTLAKLKGIYPAGYSQLKTDGQGAQYAKEMLFEIINNKIGSQEMIDRALDKARIDARTNRFLPPPAMFISWCKPSQEELGLPDVNQAYTEACNKSREPHLQCWSHPVIYHAGKTTGWYLLKTETRTVAFPAFKQAYSELCKRAMTGEVFAVVAPPERQLTADGRTPVKRSDPRTELSKMRAMFEG